MYQETNDNSILKGRKLLIPATTITKQGNKLQLKNHPKPKWKYKAALRFLSLSCARQKPQGSCCVSHDRPRPGEGVVRAAGHWFARPTLGNSFGQPLKTSACRCSHRTCVDSDSAGGGRSRNFSQGTRRQKHVRHIESLGHGKTCDEKRSL